MPTTTEVTNISQLLDLSAALGDYASEYDTDAIVADYVQALLAALDEMGRVHGTAGAAGVYVTRSGVVYADVDQAERAREIDWRELAEQVDFAAIAKRHERVTTSYTAVLRDSNDPGYEDLPGRTWVLEDDRGVYEHPLDVPPAAPFESQAAVVEGAVAAAIGVDVDAVSAEPTGANVVGDTSHRNIGVESPEWSVQVRL